MKHMQDGPFASVAADSAPAAAGHGLCQRAVEQCPTNVSRPATENGYQMNDVPWAG